MNQTPRRILALFVTRPSDEDWRQVPDLRRDSHIAEALAVSAFASDFGEFDKSSPEAQVRDRMARDCLHFRKGLGRRLVLSAVKKLYEDTFGAELKVLLLL